MLFMGYAVPMPISMRTRPYDEVFYSAMGARESHRDARRDLRDLFGDE